MEGNKKKQRIRVARDVVLERSDLPWKEKRCLTMSFERKVMHEGCTLGYERVKSVLAMVHSYYHCYLDGHILLFTYARYA